ncbi:MAG: acyl-CoA dehydrogenase family protein, partial [Halieaceae bacterium]
MALVLNEEQRLLQDTSREFLTNNAPVTSLRALRDDRDSVGYSSELWQQMAELGWASIILPEEFGGLAFGFTGLGVVMEETGRTLTASPLLTSAVIGASAILLGGNTAQKETLLPAIATGESTIALALEESHHHRPNRIATRAQADGGDYIISGSKTFVLDGHSADQLIVVARTDGETRDTSGITLFLVDPANEGVKRQRTAMMDSRNAANISFDRVRVSSDAIIGEPGQGWAVLEPTLDRARIALSAEMLGSALEAFERTVAYLK